MVSPVVCASPTASRSWLRGDRPVVEHADVGLPAHAAEPNRETDVEVEADAAGLDEHLKATLEREPDRT